MKRVIHLANWTLYNTCDNTGNGDYSFERKRVTCKLCLARRPRKTSKGRASK